MAFNLDDYVEVKDRIPLFYADHPDGRIITKMVSNADGVVVFKAGLFKDHDTSIPLATGYAYEREGEGRVNRTCYIENCETSAIGRALANAGYVGRTGNEPRPSREEMKKLERMEQAHRPRGKRSGTDSGAETGKDPAGDGGPRCPECGGKMWDNRRKKRTGKHKPNAPDFRCREKKCEGRIWKWDPDQRQKPGEKPSDDRLVAAKRALWETLEAWAVEEDARMELLQAYARTHPERDSELARWTVPDYEDAAHEIEQMGKTALEPAFEHLGRQIPGPPGESERKVGLIASIRSMAGAADGDAATVAQRIGLSRDWAKDSTLAELEQLERACADEWGEAVERVAAGT